MNKIYLIAFGFSLTLLLCLSVSSKAFYAETKQQNWLQEEMVEKHKLLEAFWQERIVKYKKESVVDFKNSILNRQFPDDILSKEKIEQLFQDAIDKKIEFNIFYETLQDQPLVLIRQMNEIEKLVPEDQYEEIIPDIKIADLNNIEDYIKNKHISVSITLGSAENKLIIPDYPQNLSQYAFAMHSVGKVFTGILVLMMIEEDVLSEQDLMSPVQLDDSVIQQLPSTVRTHLKKVTLHQLMTHTSGLGDYLGDYCHAISQGKIPVINRVEDFIPFIEDKTFPIGERRYSNAGILLVGIAIQHAYEKKFHKPVGF